MRLNLYIQRGNKEVVFIVVHQIYTKAYNIKYFYSLEINFPSATNLLQVVGKREYEEKMISKYYVYK